MIRPSSPSVKLESAAVMLSACWISISSGAIKAGGLGHKSILSCVLDDIKVVVLLLVRAIADGRVALNGRHSSSCVLGMV